jgi:hypothetical protein
MYASQIQKISDVLNGILRASPSPPILYWPADTDEMDIDLEPYGKIVVQYDPDQVPATNCEQGALVRVRVENRLAPVFEKPWPALSNQIKAQKKRANACNAPSVTTAVAPAATIGTDFVFNLSNNTVHVGDVTNANGGADYRTNMMAKLQSLCTASGCDSTKTSVINNINTVVDEASIPGKLIFTITDSSFESTAARDTMLAAAVATFEQAASKTCKEVPYKFYPSGQSCPSHKAKREAAPPADVPGTEECNGTMNVCAGADHISKFHLTTHLATSLTSLTRHRTRRLPRSIYQPSRSSD